MTVTDMPVTLGAAGILGLFYVYLSLRVVLARRDSKISLGHDGAGSVSAGKEPEAPALFVAARVHGNFSEYVPLALILMGGIESAGAGHHFLQFLALLLIVGRILHPLGLSRAAPNPFRAGGAVLTWLTIILASLDALRIAL